MNIFGKSGIAAIFTIAASTSAVWAQESINDAEREAAVASLAQMIEDEFFDAERAAAIATDLRDAEANGAFDEYDTAEALAGALSERLHEEDRHFTVNYAGAEAVAEAAARREARENQSDDGGNRDPWAGLRRANFGFAKVEILPGNIGYVEFNMFAPIDPAEDTARAVLEFIGNTDAVIFDVRGNGGGAPSMVQYLISHFVEPGGETLINTFVSRDYEYPNQMWSLPSHPAGHRPDTPLYVLTSGRTGSAGEAFPYHLQALERATIIGQSTYGAGNPGGRFLTDDGYSVFISTGSARNPITQSNWEGTGVEPHIDVPAEQALDRALIEAYATLLETTEDEGQLRTLSWAREALDVQHNPVTVDAETLERYSGDFGIRDTWVENGALMYQREGGEASTLIPLGEDRFMFSDTGDYRVVFRFDRRGRLEAMDLEVADGRVISNPVEG